MNRRKIFIEGKGWFLVCDNYPNHPYHMSYWGPDENLPSPRFITAGEFWLRLLPDEQEQFASSDNPAIKWILTNMQMTGIANLDDPTLVAKVNAAEAAGKIGEGRAAEILA